MSSRLLVFVVLQLSITAGTNLRIRAESPNWPQFRGKNATGIADEGEYPLEFNAEKNLVWKVAIPEGVSSPCIWEDRIFLTTYDPEPQRLETICLDRTSGETVWRCIAPADQIEKAYQIDIGSPASATPTTDGQRVYVYFSSHGLLCYDMDGKELWKKPLRMPQMYFGSGTSPVVVGDLVLLNRDEGSGRTKNEAGQWTRKRPESHLLAVDRLTGNTVWLAERSVDRPGYATPVHRRNGNVDEIILFGSGQITAYDLRDGREVWSLRGLPPRAYATPWINDDRLFMVGADLAGTPENVVPLPNFLQFLEQHDTNKDGKLALGEIPANLPATDKFDSTGAGNTPLTRAAGRQDKDNDGYLTTDEWKKLIKSQAKLATNLKVGIYSVTMPRHSEPRPIIDWVETKGVPEIPSPLLYQGRLYLVKSGGIMYCRDPETGKVINRRRLAATGGYYASPVGAGGRVYVASDRGMVTVLAAGDDLEVLAQNDLSGRIMATPALVDNTIYIRTEQSMYAFAEHKN